MLKDIKDFHKKFELHPLDEPGFLSKDLTTFRIRFMQEELAEFIDAYRENNLHDAFDALIDLTYVVLGTAYLMGLPFEDGWNEVHKANMAKIRTDDPSKSKRNSSVDVIKPEGWVVPDLSKFLGDVDD